MNIFTIKALLLILIVIFGICACDSSSFNPVCNHEEIIKSGKTYYQPLIEALENYKNDNGNFPAKLSQLAPKYISSQMITDENTFNAGDLDQNIGSRFESLRPNGSDSFIIRFHFYKKDGCFLYKSGVCSYYGDTKNWDCK